MTSKRQGIFDTQYHVQLEDPMQVSSDSLSEAVATSTADTYMMTSTDSLEFSTEPTSDQERMLTASDSDKGTLTFPSETDLYKNDSLLRATEDSDRMSRSVDSLEGDDTLADEDQTGADEHFSEDDLTTPTAHGSLEIPGVMSRSVDSLEPDETGLEESFAMVEPEDCVEDEDEPAEVEQFDVDSLQDDNEEDQTLVIISICHSAGSGQSNGHGSAAN